MERQACQNSTELIFAIDPWITNLNNVYENILRTELEYIRCENCMTLNLPAHKHCTICGYELSASNKVSLSSDSVLDTGNEGNTTEESGSEITDGNHYSVPQEETYLRCSKCMSLNPMNLGRCTYCGTELSSMRKVTMTFSPGSVGMLSTGYSGKEAKKSGSFGERIPIDRGLSSNRFTDWQYSVMEFILILVASTSLVAIPSVFLVLPFPQIRALVSFAVAFSAVFIFSVFNSIVFYLLYLIDNSFPMGRESKFTWGFIWFIIMVPLDIVVYVLLGLLGTAILR